MKTKTQQIAELNDHLRTNRVGGIVTVTRGIARLEYLVQDAIEQKLTAYDNFTEDNDPHGEHDFGNFEHDGMKIFWKIDYYDKHDSAWGSEDPADPEQTMRVLTVMLANEY